MKPISDARTCGDGCTYLQGRLHVLAGTDARTCEDGCTYLRERLHVLAGTVARTCGDGCTYLQGQIFSPQTFASEMGKTGAEIVSPVLDERKGGSIRHSRQPKKREKGKRKTTTNVY